MAITKIEVPELFDFGSDNSAFKLPTGTTAERPTSPSNGEMRFNTTTGYVEYYDTTDTQWWEIDYASILPSDNFNTVLYTGNSSTQAITGVGFAPDFVWIKRRNSAEDHALYDSVRGTNEQLSSNITAAQATNSSPYLGLTSFDSDGFTSGNNGGTNRSPNTYAAWNWKAGGAAVSNTDGTITSQVSANTAAGFSIVSYTGASGTVGHGLDSTPEIIIQKKTNGSEDWYVYFPPGVIDSNYNYMVLNSTAGKGTTGSTPPTTTTFNPVSSSGNYIAYAFHSVDGYSKIGTYTGNGNATGPIVTTGFEPAWVMFKRTDSTSGWNIQDNKRNSTNPRTGVLQAQSNDPEYTSSTYAVDFNSNGFQIVNSDNGWNASGGTYIYMAFAANPT